ncbi:MAG TPA: hypothetical protein VHH32_00510, partial [Gemmatimonadales bacterium]|nr:hypothetical protein [Gemmatimonadales bacterium]
AHRIGRNPCLSAGVPQDEEIENASRAGFSGPGQHEMPGFEHDRCSARGVIYHDVDVGVVARRVGRYGLREIFDAGIACAGQVKGGGIRAKGKTKAALLIGTC